MRPHYDLVTLAPGLWRGWGVFKDDARRRYYEWPVEVLDLLPLARYATVRVDGRAWTP